MSDDKVVSLGSKKKSSEEKQQDENNVVMEPVYCSFCKRPNTWS